MTTPDSNPVCECGKTKEQHFGWPNEMRLFCTPNDPRKMFKPKSIQLLTDEQFNSPDNQNRDNAIIGTIAVSKESHTPQPTDVCAICGRTYDDHYSDCGDHKDAPYWCYDEHNNEDFFTPKSTTPISEGAAHTPGDDDVYVIPDAVKNDDVAMFAPLEQLLMYSHFYDKGVATVAAEMESLREQLANWKILHGLVSDENKRKGLALYAANIERDALKKENTELVSAAKELIYWYSECGRDPQLFNYNVLEKAAALIARAEHKTE